MLLSISVGSVSVSRVVVSKKGLRLQGVRKTERQSNESKVFFLGNDSLESSDILVFKAFDCDFSMSLLGCWAVGLLEQKHESMVIAPLEPKLAKALDMKHAVVGSLKKTQSIRLELRMTAACKPIQPKLMESFRIFSWNKGIFFIKNTWEDQRSAVPGCSFSLFHGFSWQNPNAKKDWTENEIIVLPRWLP